MTVIAEDEAVASPNPPSLPHQPIHTRNNGQIEAISSRIDEDTVTISGPSTTVINRY